MSVTVATANWNGFWGVYGDRWSECVRSMSPAPDRIVVASDEPIKTDFEVVICQTKKLGPMRQAAIDFTDTEWFVPSDLDDFPLPNYVDGLGQDAEIHSYCFVWGNKVEGYRPHEWEVAFSPSCPNPLASCSAYKTEWAKRIKYRDIGWEDWAFWLDMKKAGARVFFDKTPRYIYTHGTLSRENIAEKEQEILNMKLLGVW